MSLQKRKPSVSPPNQAAQSQARGSEEFTSFPQNYQQVQQPGYPVQAALPHDMSKQSVVAGHLPAAGIPQQTANIYQQQPGIIQAQTYFGANQQSMRPTRSFNTPMAQPNQPVYHNVMMYMGQPQAQYSAGNVMVQPQQMMGYSTGQRMPTPSYTIPSSQPIQQQFQQAAPYQPSQQYPNQSAYMGYYQSQPMPVNQPQRPPSAPGPAAAPASKRERKPIQIVDPNTGREVTEEILHLKSTPPGGSARSTPGSTGVPGSAGSTPPPQSMGMPNDIAAQFAAQVAATLRPGSTGSSRQEYTADQMQDAGAPTEFAPVPQEFVPAVQSDSVLNSDENFSPQLVPGSESQERETSPEQTQEKDIPKVPVKDSNVELSNDHNIVPGKPDSSSPVLETHIVVDAVIQHLPTEHKTEVTSTVQSQTVQDDQGATETVVEKPCAPVVEASTDLPTPSNSVDMQALSTVSSMDAPRELLQKNQRIDVSDEALVTVERKAEVKYDTVVKEAEVSVKTPEPSIEVAGIVSSIVPQKPSDRTTETTVVDSNISKDVKSKGKKKLKDINRKGEEKEGTDMDAFLDIQENEVHTPSVETKTDKIQTTQEPPKIESKTIASSKIIVELSKPVVETSKASVEISKQVEESKPVINKPDVEMSKGVVEPSKPAVEISKPAVEVSKPTVEVSKPTVEVSKPTVEVSKPTVEVSKPTVEVSKPTIEVSKPTVEVSKPTVEVSKPASEVSKPAVEVSKPAVEVSKPAVEVSKPAVEVSKPAVEVSKPTVDVSKPTVDVSKPTVDVSKPTVEVSKPAVEVSKPAVEVSKPAVEVSKPLDDSANPELSKPEVEGKTEDAPTQQAPVQIVITEPAAVPKEVEIEIKDAKVSKDSEVSRENAKNNVKTNEANTENTENATPKYKYKEDQWSPLNPEGKCQYDRSFLLQLQYAKDSMTKPNALPNLPDIILDKPYCKENNPPKNFEPRFNMPDFTPGYARGPKMGGGGGGGGGGGVGPGSMTKRGSQSRMREPRIIKSVSIQREEVKLHKCDTAWKPGHKDEKKEDEQGSKTDDLNKKVKSILNKLTPQKFQTLLTQMHGLTIDTEERLKGVTDLIFEKAISEPGFSVAYANMCRYLLMLKVPSETKEGDFVNFRVILLTRCQREFERDKDDQEILDKKRKEVEDAAEDKKAQLKEELDMESSRARRRSIGNIRFIGELFKLKMLTENIMHDCVFKLLRSRDEENLECLCRLLTTIGKELESEKAKPRMDQYFLQMHKIVADKKVSSRCRFMLQDVIDLRTNRWVPRRDENKPKTIDQIHKEAKQEEIQRQMVSQFNAQQPTKRNRPRGPPQQMGQGGNMGEDGWNTVSSKAGMRNIDRNIDVSKLRINKSSDDNIQLGPGGGARTFGGWGRGSSGGGSRGSQEGERPNAPGNRYAALSKEDDQRSRAFGRGVSPHRGQGRTPGGFQKPRVGLRGSQELERERAIASARTIVSGRSTPPSAPTSREGSRTREQKPKEPEKPVEPVKELTQDEMEQKTKAIIDEYLHLQDKKEAVLCVTELRSPGMIHIFVQTAINHVLERSQPARRQTGLLLHDLIQQNVITVDTYLKGSIEILQYAEDMEIDIPKIWKYFGELIGPMVQDGSVPLSFLGKACRPLVESKKAGILVAEILHDASQQIGHKVVAELWKNSGLVWTDFVPEAEVDQFIKEKALEFTVGPTSQPSTPTSKISFEKIHDDLKEQLTKAHCDNESVFDWIEANVSEETTKEPKFIRALMTAVCSSAISGLGNMAKVEQESIRMRRPLLQKYLEHKALFELQALYALQALVCKLEHPPGVLRTFFDTLYDEEIISEDAFNQWENSSDAGEKDGKGVALKQVVQFFAWLREGEEDENDS